MEIGRIRLMGLEEMRLSEIGRIMEIGRIRLMEIDEIQTKSIFNQSLFNLIQSFPS